MAVVPSSSVPPRGAGAARGASRDACPPRRSARAGAGAAAAGVEERGRTAAGKGEFTSLPVVDLEPLVAYARAHGAGAAPPDVREEVRECCRAIDEACRSCGFFYVRNHGVPEELVSGVRALSREFFANPRAEKERLRLGAGTSFRGYQALGDNVTRFETEDGRPGFSRDWHEAIDMYKEVSDLAQVGGLPSPLHGRTPTRNPSVGELAGGMDDALREYTAEMLALSRTIMRGMAIGLGLGEEDGGEMAFVREGVADESYWVMRIINYPPLSFDGEGTGGEIDRSVRLSCGEHSDYGMLTLVNQDEHVRALQVKNAAGDWVDAPPVRNTFVCNIGDMLETMTDGAYRSTLHRVVNDDPEATRLSIPFFFEPNFHSVIKPLPSLVARRGAAGAGAASTPSFSVFSGAGDARVESVDAAVFESGVVYGSHLESKVLNNFELNRDDEEA